MGTIWKFSALLGCPFPGLLAGDSRFFSLCLLFSKIPASSALSLGYIRQKENPGNSPHVIPWVLRSLVFMPFLHLSESSCVFFLYNVQLSVVLAGGIGQCTSTSSSWKQKSPLFKLVPTMSNHINSWKNEDRFCGRDLSLRNAYVFGQI